KRRKALARALNSKIAGECRLAVGCVLASRLAERGGIALDVEQIVGDLEGLAECVPVTIKGVVGALRGLAKDRARNTSKPDQCAGLHGVERHDLLFGQAGRVIAAFGCEIEHLASGHAAET